MERDHGGDPTVVRTVSFTRVFEPSRLAADALRQGYEAVVPINARVATGADQPLVVDVSSRKVAAQGA